MMRLPRFRYYAPHSLAEAARILAAEGPVATIVAGGTDLLPKMKRMQLSPQILVSLGKIPALKEWHDGEQPALGAGMTLSDLVSIGMVRNHYAGLRQAAVQIATPHLRNMGTLGGNLCLDTRCTYYDQNQGWRRAIGHCMKKDGQTCWVSTGSKRCLATSSTDTAPILIALGAEIVLKSNGGERKLPLANLYLDDGIDYHARSHDEILTSVSLPGEGDRRSTYWKLRRRGSFDFPVLSVAAAGRREEGNRFSQIRLVLGAVASRPLLCEGANAFLQNKPLSDEVIQEASALAARAAKPVKNTDFTPHWRRQVIAKMARYALQELRGDDMREARKRFARQALQ